MPFQILVILHDISEQNGVAVMLCTCIWEVPGLHLSQDNG